MFDFSDAIVNTSWLTGLVCFGLAGGNFYFAYNEVGKLQTLFAGVSWVLFGLCYILTQFGGDWFVMNQRAYFRIAINLVLAAQMYALWEAYKTFKPLIEAKARQDGEPRPNDV